MNLHTLIMQATETPELPPGFTDGVLKRIAERALRRERHTLLRDAILLGGASLIFFHALAVLLVNTIALETLDFLSLAVTEPGLLAGTEGRLAVLDALPMTSFLLTGVSMAMSILLFRLFLRDIAAFPILLFRRHAYT